MESVASAGISKVHVVPIIGSEKDKKLGTEYEAVLGKEYDQFKFRAKLECNSHKPIDISIRADGVKAAAAQARAASAIEAVRAQLTKLGEAITPAAKEGIITLIQQVLAPGS